MTSYQSSPSPPPHLLDLHPAEILLVLLWISAAALLRLVANPPRLIRQRLLVAGCDVTADGLDIYVLPTEFASWGSFSIRQPPANATVVELRREARARGLASVGGRPIHKARRADLLEALY